MRVISNWLNVKKYPVEQVMDISGQKYPSSVEAYKMIDAEEQRKLINKFYPLG